MINLSRARTIAQKFLDKKFKNRVEVKIIENEAMEIEFGWLLFYDSKKAVETGNFRHQLSGNYPLLVDKYISEVTEVISDDVDGFLEEYYESNKHKWKI